MTSACKKTNKMFARWIPDAFNELQKKQSFSKDLLSECVNLAAKIYSAKLSRESKGGYPSVGSKPREPVRCEKMNMGQRPANLGTGFQGRKRFVSPIYFSFDGQVAEDILPEECTLTATYYVKTVISKAIQSVSEKRSTVGTRNNTLRPCDNVSTRKAKIIVPYLKE